jgi:undecaprenyl-phosphate 4-deoxy-4-formamido-L-arabinose transferase
MFLNFSILPLRLSSLSGIILSAIGVVMAILVVIEKLANPHIAIGWPSTVVIITIFSGVQLFIMGVLGEYIGTMFLSQNRTPQFVVREIYEGKNGLDQS